MSDSRLKLVLVQTILYTFIILHERSVIMVCYTPQECIRTGGLSKST